MSVECSATGKYSIRSLHDAEKLKRRQAYSSYLSLNPPSEMLPYRTPLLPPASRYSRPGAMDPQLKHNRRMGYSASLSAIHAETLGNEDGRYVSILGEEANKPRIDANSAFSKRLAYDKSLSKTRQASSKEKGCGCCSVCLLHGAPPLRYSAQGSMIGHAPLKASWSNTVAGGVAYPDVSVHGHSCSLTFKRENSHDSTCLATVKSSRSEVTSRRNHNSCMNFGCGYQTSGCGYQTSRSGYHLTSTEFTAHQFRSNTAEVLQHVKVSTRRQPHLLARPPVLRVTGLCQDTPPPPNSPRCADKIYNTLICAPTLGDRYGNQGMDSQIIQHKSTKVTEKRTPNKHSYKPYF